MTLDLIENHRLKIFLHCSLLAKDAKI